MAQCRCVSSDRLLTGGWLGRRNKFLIEFFDGPQTANCGHSCVASSFLESSPSIGPTKIDFAMTMGPRVVKRLVAGRIEMTQHTNANRNCECDLSHLFLS